MHWLAMPSVDESELDLLNMENIRLTGILLFVIFLPQPFLRHFHANRNEDCVNYIPSLVRNHLKRFCLQRICTK